MDPDAYIEALIDKADDLRKREKEERLDEKKKPRIPPYDPQTDWPERYHGNDPWRPI